MILISIFVGILVLIALGVEVVRHSTWGLPRWPGRPERPFQCSTCGREFPGVPPGCAMGEIGSDGLLALHVRHEHQGAPGPLLGRLPKRKAGKGDVLRPPPERWHGFRQDLMTEAQWRSRFRRKGRK